MKKQIILAIIIVAVCLIAASQIQAQHTFDPPEYTECEKAYNALDLAEIEVNMYARHIYRDSTYSPTTVEFTRYTNSIVTYKRKWFEACNVCQWGDCEALVEDETFQALNSLFYQNRN